VADRSEGVAQLMRQGGEEVVLSVIGLTKSSLGAPEPLLLFDPFGNVLEREQNCSTARSAMVEDSRAEAQLGGRTSAPAQPNHAGFARLAFLSPHKEPIEHVTLADDEQVDESLANQPTSLPSKKARTRVVDLLNRLVLPERHVAYWRKVEELDVARQAGFD